MQQASQRLELLRALVGRELKARYRGSYLGWLWALSKPLVLLTVYGLVIGVFLGAAQEIPEFMLFVYVGLMAWTLFSLTVTGCVTVITNSASLITKSKFPVILLPISTLIVALVDLVVLALVLCLGYVIVGDWPSLSGIPFLLLALVGLCLFGLALGLVFSALNVYVRDMAFLLDVGLQVGFWLCPIVYSYGFVVKAAETYSWPVEAVTRLYMLNPIANGVLGFQRALWPPASTTEGALLSFPGQLGLRLALLVAVGAVFLAVAVWIFQRLSRNFAQEL
jgi:ABC-2 type transport system permease protein